MSARYLVKWGDLYADGCRGWVKRRRDAFVFLDGASVVGDSGKAFAERHIDTYRGSTVRQLGSTEVLRVEPHAKDLRVVRLVRRRRA